MREWMYSMRETCDDDGEFSPAQPKVTDRGALPTHQLISEEEDSLEGEFAVAKVEEVLEGWAKEVNDHCIVVALDPVPSHERDADTSGKGLWAEAYWEGTVSMRKGQHRLGGRLDADTRTL